MSKNLKFGLVLTADGTALTKTLDKVEAALDKVEKTSSKAGAGVSKTFDRLKQRAKQTTTRIQNFGGRSDWANKRLKGFKTSLEQTARRSINFGRNIGEAAGKLAVFGGAFATLTSALSLGSLVDTQRQFDVLNSQLITATGGIDQAAVAFNDLTKFASTTPYALEQSVMGFTQLKNLGLDPSMRSMRSYGNFAAAMGKDLNQMIEAVADASTFEFERLKEFGIKASQQGDKVSLTFQGVTTTVAKKAQDIKQYLLSIGETKFGEAMANRAKTLDGAISNLGDNWNSFKLAIVRGGVGEVIQDIVVNVADGLASMTSALQEPANAQKIKSVIDEVANAFNHLQSFAAASAETMGNVTEFFIAHQDIIIPLASGVAAAAGAFGLFTAGVAAWSAVGTLATAVTAGFGAAVALVTSPVTLTLAAIGGLVAVGVLLYRNWDTIKAKATDVFSSLPAPVQEAFGNIKQTFSTLKQWATTAFDFLAPYVKTTMTVVSALFTARWAIIKSIFTTTFGAIKAIVSTNFAVIKATFTAGLSIIATVFNTTFKLIKNGFKTTFNAIKALASGDIKGFVSIIGAGLKNAVAIVGRGVINIAKVFATLGAKLFNIGKDVVQGLINGIKAKFAAVKNIATDMANTVLSALNIGFDRHSPAKKTIAIGLDVGTGLIIGLNNKKSEAYQTALQLAKSVMDGMSSLNKEIALFGNDSPLASFDYDRKAGVYKGIKDSVLDSYRELIRLKAQLTADEKISNFETQQQTSLADYAFETSLIGKTADEIQRLRFERNLLNQAEQAGIDLSDEALQALIAQREELAALRKQQEALQANDWVGGIKSGLQSLIDNAKTLNQTMEDATKSAFNKMSDGLANFVATGKGNFRDLTVSILQDISKMMFKWALFKAMSAIGGAIGGNVGAAMQTVFQSKGGGWTNGVQFYANGGVFDRPTAFGHAGGLGVLGEAGPEAVMPLTRGANGKLGVQVYGNKQASQSAGVVNQVQIDIRVNNEGASSDVQTTTQDSKQLADSLKAVVLQTLQNETRPGGMLAHA
ncbi:phage tail tape measure protein [Psychrobacter sp. HD31]|uniref:phage tail tape measure protein n=1 Tax=Psychrobacter sp. HD31 TaxID=3112003 RepID=UPI003DA5F735